MKMTALLAAPLVLGLGLPALAQQTFWSRETASLDPYETLGMDLSTPERALAEIAGYMANRDDLRLSLALAPEAHDLLWRGVRTFDMEIYAGPDGGDARQLSDAAANYLTEFTRDGEPGMRIGDLSQYFPAYMSAARELGGPVVDLSGAEPTGDAVTPVGEPGALPMVRMPIRGPRLREGAAAFFERSPAGRWRLRGVRVHLAGGPWDWLAVPED